MKVVELTDTLPEQASVIETLEEVLAEARKGRIRAVAIAVVRPSLFINTTWSESDCGPSLIGALELLRHRLIRSLDTATHP